MMKSLIYITYIVQQCVMSLADRIYLPSYVYETLADEFFNNVTGVFIILITL